MARLIMTRKERTQEYELLDETTLGRSSKNTIRVPEGKASRMHARIVKRGEDFILEDLNSSNGTFHNGQKVSTQRLRPNDEIRIGNTLFAFVEEIDDPLVGAQLGNYYIEERLGKGGMGVVYRARQVTMDRNVALKVMRPDFARNPNFIKDFMREARLAGRLQHVNIIGIHDFGEQDGHYFFSMEYVKGENLSDRLDRTGIMKIEELLDVTAQAADALQHAHEMGVLHQDIKPENLMMTEDGRIKVADLGLAKAMSYGNAVQNDRPAMGTPRYVSPEVVSRKSADQRSDIYSLGASLFHLATGRAPYAGDNVMEIIQAHVRAPVPDPRSINPKLNDDFAELIMQCMAKTPDDRPADCAEILRRVEELRNSLGISRSSRISGALRSTAPVAKPAAPMPSPVADAAAVAEAFSEPEPLKSHHGDSTDHLPAPNPYRIHAIAICVALSILVTVLLCWAMYILVKGNGAAVPDSQAAKLLQEAKAQITQARNHARAEELLMQLQNAFPDSPEAVEAGTMLGDIRAKIAESGDGGRRNFEEIKSGVERELFDKASATSLLRSLLASGNLDAGVKAEAEELLAGLNRKADVSNSSGEDNSATAENVDPTREEKSEKAWSEAKPIIDRELAGGKYAEAKELLEAFVRNHKGTAAAAKAQAELDKVEKQTVAAARAIFEQAERDKQTGMMRAAINGFNRVAESDSDGEWGKRAKAELASLDRDAHNRFSNVWQSAVPRIAPLTVGLVRPDADRLIKELDQLPWEKAARDFSAEMQAVDSFSGELVAAVKRKGVTDLSVIGIGEVKVGINFANKPTATLGDVTEIIAWDRFYVEDIAALVPESKLSDVQKLGAALYFMARKHYGYALSYTNKMSPKVRDSRLVNQMFAHRDGRIITEWFDFDDAAENQRWQQVEGEWRFSSGKLSTNDSEGAAMRLSDRIFSPVNLAIKYQSLTAAGGQAAVLIDAGKGRHIALRRTGPNVVLEFSSEAGAVERTDVAPSDPSKPILLVLDGDNASAVQNGTAVSEIATPGAAGWAGRLKLEIIGTAGSFEHVSVEEKP